MLTKTYGRQKRFETLCSEISKLAHQLGPGAKLPTMLQLRDSLGVSVATLDSALSELEAQNIISRKHGVGIYVSSKLHQKAISLVCDPSFFRAANASPFWEILVEQARKRAESGNEDFSLHFSNPYNYKGSPLNEGLMHEIRSGRVHGLLSVGLSQQAADWIITQGIPFVSFAGPAEWLVTLDNSRVVQYGVQELIARGCAKLGFWAPVAPNRPHPHDISVPTRSYLLFKEMLQSRGLCFLPEDVKENLHLVAKVGSEASESHQEQGYRTALEVFGSRTGAKPDGLIIGDDMMTYGALVAMQKLGMRIGEDVKIVTHANRGSTVLLGYDDLLIRIEVDPAAVVDAMYSQLETLMDGQKPSSNVVTIHPILVRP